MQVVLVCLIDLLLVDAVLAAKGDAFLAAGVGTAEVGVAQRVAAETARLPLHHHVGVVLSL